MKAKKKKRITKLESFLYEVSAGIAIFLIVGIVFGQTALAQINLEVQYLKSEVEDAENVNTGLAMKINEMASLENIEEVSEEEGLTYNSDNIKTIK